jgi:hypothetical protein
MKTILLKKQIIFFVFVFLSTDLFAQIPADPGDDQVNKTEASQQSQTTAATEKSEEDINIKESKSATAVFSEAAVSVDGKKPKKNAVSKNNAAKNSSEKRASKKRK